MTNGLKIGYAYDSSITAVSNYRRGNHEVILKFPIQILGKQSKPTTINEL